MNRIRGYFADSRCGVKIVESTREDLIVLVTFIMIYSSKKVE